MSSIQVGQYPDVAHLMHNGDHPGAVSTNQGSWLTATNAVSAGWPVPADGAEGYTGVYKIYVTYGGASCQYLIWVKAS